MALNPNIILSGKPIDLQAGINNALLNQQRRQQMAQSAEMQPFRNQLLQQQVQQGEQSFEQGQQRLAQGQAMSRESTRQEIGIGLRAMKPFVDAGDLAGAGNVLRSIGLSPEVSQRLAQGLTVGDPASIKSDIDSSIAALSGPAGTPKLSSTQQKVVSEGIDPFSEAGFQRAREINQRAATDPSLKRGANEIINRATGEQLKSAGFANRINSANKGLKGLEASPDFNPTSIAAATLRSVPGGNIGLSSDQQSYQQFKEDFITAVLRKESGAVISDEEFAREEKKFFPQIGDKDSTLKQKAKGRQRAFQNFKQESKGVFDIQFGESTEQATPQQFQEGQTATNPQTQQKVIFRNGQWQPI